MKLLCFLFVLIISNYATANETQLGVILGSTTGLSFKYDLGAARAIDGALSYSADGKYGFSAHSDYLFNKARQFTLEELSPLNLYYGLGVRLLDILKGTDKGKARVGIRAPIGLYHQTNNPNLEFFGELVPILDLTPSTDVFIDVGLGVRIRFQ